MTDRDKLAVMINLFSSELTIQKSYWKVVIILSNHLYSYSKGEFMTINTKRRNINIVGNMTENIIVFMKSFQLLRVAVNEENGILWWLGRCK